MSTNNQPGAGAISSSNPALLHNYNHTSTRAVSQIPEHRRRAAHNSTEWRLQRLQERLSAAPIAGFAADQRDQFDKVEATVQGLRHMQQQLFLEQFKRFPAVHRDANTVKNTAETSKEIERLNNSVCLKCCSLYCLLFYCVFGLIF